MSKHAGSSAQAEPRGQPLPSSPFLPLVLLNLTCLLPADPLPPLPETGKVGSPTKPTPHHLHKPRWSAATSLRGWASCLQRLGIRAAPGTRDGCHCSCRPLSRLPQWGLQSYQGLRALVDPGFSPCVTSSQAFDLSAPQFPHTSNGHNEFVEL